MQALFLMIVCTAIILNAVAENERNENSTLASTPKGKNKPEETRYRSIVAPKVNTETHALSAKDMNQADTIGIGFYGLPFAYRTYYPGYYYSAYYPSYYRRPFVGYGFRPIVGYWSYSAWPAYHSG